MSGDDDNQQTYRLIPQILPVPCRYNSIAMIFANESADLEKYRGTSGCNVLFSYFPYMYIPCTYDVLSGLESNVSGPSCLYPTL